MAEGSYRFKEQFMKAMFGILMMAAGVTLAGITFAQATSQPATSTKPALPACCGEKCKTMVNCCKTDAAGKRTCGMGGSCCEKPK